MIQWFVKKVLGTKNQREVKRLWPLVEKINALEVEYQGLMDEQLIAKTTQFKERFGKGETLDDLLPEAFAVVKNACRRLTERKHMSPRARAGSGLGDDSVRRAVDRRHGAPFRPDRGNGDGRRQDAGGDFPGLSQRADRARRACGDGQRLPGRARQRMDGRDLPLSQPDRRLHPARAESRRSAASNTMCDIVYGTNSEMGFDYLRDNGMATTKAEQVQRGHTYAIVDEVDSILIDEARTPLIIAGPGDGQLAPVRQIQGRRSSGSSRRRACEANRWAAEAKKQIDEGKIEEAGRLLFKIKNSTPTQQAAAEDDRGAANCAARWTTRSWRFTRTRARPSSTR